MVNKTIAVDCDLVLAASDTVWWDWMCRLAGTSHPKPSQRGANYNLSEYLKVALREQGRDPFDFWRGTTVYDFIEPVAGSIAAIRALKKTGFDIIVVTHVKGNSNKSKYQFIQRYFGEYIDGYIATKEKHYVACDYMIDDRNSNLNKFNRNTTCIQLETCYTQDESQLTSTKSLPNWEEIKRFILREECIIQT